MELSSLAEDAEDVIWAFHAYISLKCCLVFNTQQSPVPDIMISMVSISRPPASPSLTLPSSLETVEARVRQQGLQKDPREEEEEEEKRQKGET